MRRLKTSWYRGNKSHSRKSAFGGKVATTEEVEALNQKIKHHEAQEFAEFEESFDEQLKDL